MRDCENDEIRLAIGITMALVSRAFTGSRFGRRESGRSMGLAIAASDRAALATIMLGAEDDVCLKQHAASLRQLRATTGRLAPGEIGDEEGRMLGDFLEDGRLLLRRGAGPEDLHDFWSGVSGLLEGNSLLYAAFQDTAIRNPTIFRLRENPEGMASASLFIDLLKTEMKKAPPAARASVEIVGDPREAFLAAAREIFPNLRDPQGLKLSLSYAPLFDLAPETMKAGADGMNVMWLPIVEPVPLKDWNWPEIIAPGWMKPDGGEKRPEKPFSPGMR